MKETELPAGYVILSGVSIHVSELRKYTSDVHRFMHLLPITKKLVDLMPGTPEWDLALSDAISYPAVTEQALMLTMRESGALYTALADRLEPFVKGAPGS